MTDIEEAKQIIAESGNSFHHKAVTYLNSKGWHTTISPYYLDSSLNKPREIDLIAEKFIVLNEWDSVGVRLFVECKYIPQINVFWFSQKDIGAANNLVGSSTPIKPRNPNSLRHHYLHSSRNKVAKLFASAKKASSENEVIYKAINQSLNAMVYMRPQPFSRARGSHHPKFTLNYPIILCNGFEKFYSVDMDHGDAKEPTRIKDNFMLEVNYAYIHPNRDPANEYFLVDVVDFSKISSFLELIDEDVTVSIDEYNLENGLRPPP